MEVFRGVCRTMPANHKTKDNHKNLGFPKPDTIAAARDDKRVGSNKGT